MRIALRCTTWLCLSVMLWTASAEPAHNHSRLASSGSCTLCIATHNVAPPPVLADRGPKLVAVEVVLLVPASPVLLAATPIFGVRGPPLA